MPNLAKQRHLIEGLERTVQAERPALLNAAKAIDFPTKKVMVTVGTVLIATDLAPGVKAAAQLFIKRKHSGAKCKACMDLGLQAPVMLSTLQKLFGSR